MTDYLPSVRLTGANVLRDGEMQKRSVAIADGVFTRGPLPEVDLTGYVILPGIIDLHGDAFERHMAPRASAPFPARPALKSAARDAAANGVTTAWFAQSWSWEGGWRSPEFALEILQAHRDVKDNLPVDIRVQIRCETHTVDYADQLLKAVRDFDIDYVIFNNHLPEAVEMTRERPVVFADWAARHGRSPEEHLACVNKALEETSQVPRYLCRLAEAFDQAHIAYGSHDDPDGETRERFRMIGARISEFPTTVAAAQAAKAMGDPVIMGAPNVVRGGSQSGNIAAEKLIRQGLCDALVSDYYYPALAQAAWRLVDQGIMQLPAAWDLISRNPAEILGLHDRGVIAPGKRADLLVIHEESREIEAVISGGRFASLTGEAGRRFMNGSRTMSLAAE